MAKVYVAEFVDLARMTQGDSAPVIALPPTVEYSVIVSAAVSGAAQPILPTTKFIGLSCDTTCSVAIGGFPGTLGTGTALLTNMRLNANERVLVAVPNSPQYGGASTIPQIFRPQCVFTTSNV